MVRQRSATPLSPVQIWVEPPKKRYPSRDAVFLFFGGPSDLNCVLRAIGEAESSSHTPLVDRGACSPGGERGYLRLRRIPGWLGIPSGCRFSFLWQSIRFELCSASHSEAESSSHTPLGDRGACSPGEERGYLHHR